MCCATRTARVVREVVENGNEAACPTSAAQPLGRRDGMDVGRRTTVTCDRESRWYNKAFAAQRSAWTPPVNNTYVLGLLRPGQAMRRAQRTDDIVKGNSGSN